MDDDTPHGALSVVEFARLHSIGRSTVYEEISAGRLIARKFRSRTLVTIEDARAWRASLPKLAPGICTAEHRAAALPASTLATPTNTTEHPLATP
jgi:hypothetical protein